MTVEDAITSGDAGMTAVEREELNHYEEIIARGIRTFVQVGDALLSIRNRRLYRSTREEETPPTSSQLFLEINSETTPYSHAGGDTWEDTEAEEADSGAAGGPLRHGSSIS
jgi:hypothetical protein